MIRIKKHKQKRKHKEKHKGTRKRIYGGVKFQLFPTDIGARAASWLFGDSITAGLTKSELDALIEPILKNIRNNMRKTEHVNEAFIELDEKVPAKYGNLADFRNAISFLIYDKIMKLKGDSKDLNNVANKDFNFNSFNKDTLRRILEIRENVTNQSFNFDSLSKEAKLIIDKIRLRERERIALKELINTTSVGPRSQSVQGTGRSTSGVRPNSSGRPNTASNNSSLKVVERQAQKASEEDDIETTQLLEGNRGATPLSRTTAWGEEQRNQIISDATKKATAQRTERELDQLFERREMPHDEKLKRLQKEREQILGKIDPNLAKKALEESQSETDKRADRLSLEAAKFKKQMQQLTAEKEADNENASKLLQDVRQRVEIMVDEINLKRLEEETENFSKIASDAMSGKITMEKRAKDNKDANDLLDEVHRNLDHMIDDIEIDNLIKQRIEKQKELDEIQKKEVEKQKKEAEQRARNAEKKKILENASAKELLETVVKQIEYMVLAIEGENEKEKTRLAEEKFQIVQDNANAGKLLTDVKRFVSDMVSDIDKERVEAAEAAAAEQRKRLAAAAAAEEERKRLAAAAAERKRLAAAAEEERTKLGAAAAAEEERKKVAAEEERKR